MKLFNICCLPSLLSILVFTIYTFEPVLSQDFNSACNSSLDCTPGTFLKCVNFSCECDDPENQIFDPVEGQCVILAGRPCTPDYSTGEPICVQGAECNSTKNICECSKGFYETDLNICSYTIGKTCSINGDCDTVSGLQCKNGMCRCSSSSFVWQVDFGCVSTTEIVPAFTSETTLRTSVFPSISTENSDLMNNVGGSLIFPEIITTNANSGEDSIPANASINPIISNSVENIGQQQNDMNLTQISIASDPTTVKATEQGIDYGDRLNLFPSSTNRNPVLNLVNQIIPPIFNPLHPDYPLNSNRNWPPVNFIPNEDDEYFQYQPPQRKNTSTNPQNSYQQNQANSQANIFNPAPIPSNLANPQGRPLRPTDLLNLRRFTLPLKRLLFPRLFSAADGSPQDVELPSPIWVVVSSINQVLPVLRAIDYQLAPVLRNLAAITRPKYLDNLVKQNQKYVQSRSRDVQIYNDLGNDDDEKPQEKIIRQQQRRNNFPLFRFPYYMQQH